MTSKTLLQVSVGVIAIGILVEQVFIPQFFAQFTQPLPGDNSHLYDSINKNKGPAATENTTTAPVKPEAPSINSLSPTDGKRPLDISAYAKTRLQIGKFFIDAMVASNDDEWTQGLSGAKSLARGEGMWFVFNNDEARDFWMPDMNFPIDIIFVDRNNIVLNVAANAQPETDLTHPKIFSSVSDARYVLEIPAGDAARMGIKAGTKIIDMGSKNADRQ